MAQKLDGPPRLTGSDFSLWRFQFTLWLGIKDLEGVWEGSERRPGANEAEASAGVSSQEGAGARGASSSSISEGSGGGSAALRTGRHRLSAEEQAFQYLYWALEGQLELPKMLIDLKGKQGAAAQAWKRVQDRHLQKGLLSILTWRKRFYTMERNYGDGENMVQYLQRVDEYVRVLEELNYKVDEKKIIYTALQGLDQEANEALLQYLHLEQQNWTKAWIWQVLVSDEARKRDAGRGIQGGMGAGDRAASKKYQQRQEGGGKKKELDKCLVPGCNRKHSWKECWRRPDGWKPQGYPGEAPPVTRPEWVERRMKKGAWNKKGSKGKSEAAAANDGGKGKEESSDDGFSFLTFKKETVLAGRVWANPNYLVLDSGATCGMVPRHDLFTTYHSLPPNSRNVIVGSGDTLQAIGIGTITIKGKEGEVLHVKGVLHVPGLAANLFSCSQLARQDYICTFTIGGCTVRKGGAVVMEAKLDKGLYLVPMCVPHVEKTLGVEAEDAACSTRWKDVEQVTADLLHLCTGHAGKQHLMVCVKKGELKGVEIKEGGGQPSKCLDCITGKLPRTSFPSSTTRASASLELVHMDVCGPMQTPDREKGSKYFITFLDDFSRLSWVTLLKMKDEVAKVFKRRIRYAEREAGAKVKILRSDRGGDYMGKDLEFFLEDKGTTHQLSVAYTPQQNGAAERLNRTLIDLARAMLAHAQLDHTWSGAAVQYANWVKSWMGSKGLGGKSPYFMWTRKVPSVSMARVWGCMAQYKVPDQQRRKLDPKVQWGIFLRVLERSKAGMLWSVADHRVVERRDVVFHEGLSYKGWKEHGASTAGSSLQDPYTSSIFEGTWEEPGEEVEEQQEEHKVAATHHEDSPTASSTPDPNKPAHGPQQPEEQQQQQQQPPQQHTPPVLVGRWQRLLLQQLSKSPRSPMKRVTWKEKLQSLEQREASPLRRTTRISQPPERFTPSAQYACMHDHEVHDLEECMLVDAEMHVPKSVKEALSRPEWVESMRDELESHRVNESFELVDPACVPPRMEVLRCQWVWKYKHMADGSIERPKSRLVAMGNTQTRGIHYDQWYLKFDEALMDFGFEKIECDPALYHLVRDEGRLSIYLYVDDILLMSSSMVLLDEVKGLLSSCFHMKDLGEAKYYLGVQIERDESGILIHQERYIINMLESFGLSEANPMRTPLPTRFDVHAHAEEPLLRDELVQLYQSIVGSLMYASTTTQPQIAYAVSRLSKVVYCPKIFHLQVAKRVLRYLKGCIKSGIFYPTHSKPQVELVGFSDADYAGDSADCKSHTGYVYCLNGAAISWQSKRQPVVALSTTKSVLVSGLPRSLPPLPPSPAPPCLPCVEGRQRATPHSSLFPPTTTPLQTLHMDVGGPARVSGQGHERYFLLVVDDYTRYTTVFPLCSKASNDMIQLGSGAS
ncbi:unnamed protein product [Closterium sp. NIES-53]